MHDLLTQLLQVNLAAVAAIVGVLLLRKSVRAGFGARIGYGLWLLVPLAAAASLAPPRPAAFLPVLPVSPASAAPLVEAAEEGAAALWTWGVEAAAPAGLDPAGIVLGLWLAGVLLTAAWLAWRQAQFLVLLRRGEAGPAVVGVLRPRIVTPNDFEQRFDLREQAVVLAHERIHLARHDARINALVALARCVCWFNPLVHIAAHTLRMDQELACDAAVVARHPKARAPYAQALLKAQLAAKPLPLGCYWPAGNEHPLTERIAMLKHANPSRARRLCGAALVAVLSAGAGYAAWAAAPAAAPAVAAPLAFIEEALTPAPVIIAQPQPAPAQPAPAAPSQPAAASPPAQPPQFDPAEIDAQGRPRYGRAFVELYDGGDPIAIDGVVVRIDWRQPNAALWVYGRGTGKDAADFGERLWRVDGGAPQTLSREARATDVQLVGGDVHVRGYGAKDKSCSPTCRVNGRDVTFANGDKIFQTAPGKPDCVFEQLRDFSCPGSDRPSPIPTPPSGMEIAQAMIRAGKDPGAIPDR